MLPDGVEHVRRNVGMEELNLVALPCLHRFVLELECLFYSTSIVNRYTHGINWAGRSGKERAAFVQKGATMGATA